MSLRNIPIHSLSPFPLPPFPQTKAMAIVSSKLRIQVFMDSTYYFVDIIYKLITGVIVKIMGKEEYFFLEIKLLPTCWYLCWLVKENIKTSHKIHEYSNHYEHLSVWWSSYLCNSMRISLCISIVISGIIHDVGNLLKVILWTRV